MLPNRLQRSLSIPTPALMRFSILVCVTCAALLTSCAYEGVIVQKDARPLPFTHTAGVEGSYAFLLRDNAGTVRRQIVTPEVYNQYAVGEYFSDLQPPSAGRDPIDAKVVRTAALSTPLSSTQVASARKANTARTVAAKPASKSAVAKTAAASRKPNSLTGKPKAAVAKQKPAGSRPAPVVAKAAAVSAKVTPATAKTNIAPKQPTVVAAKAKPSPAQPAPKTAKTATAASTGQITTSATVTSKPAQRPVSPTATRPQPQPYRPPTPSESTVGFVTIARCR